jgi:hypothetical protein
MQNLVDPSTSVADLEVTLEQPHSYIVDSYAMQRHNEVRAINFATNRHTCTSGDISRYTMVIGEKRTNECWAMMVWFSRFHITRSYPLAKDSQTPL